MGSIAVEVRDLWKKYKFRHSSGHSLQLKSAIYNLFGKKDGKGGDFYVLKGVNFSVQRGEMLGIIGENGSGKTTILKLISKIIQPTSGYIGVYGRVSTLLELGAGFHPEFSGAENIFLNGTILGLNRERIRNLFNEIVEFAELREFIDMPIKYYSSGMQMRLGFAIAIHVDFDILLIDEILAVGDRAFQEKCLSKIMDFRKQNKAIIFVSHDLNSVIKYCDRALWIKDGKVESEGDCERVVFCYLDYMRGKHEFDHLLLESELRWGSREVEIVDVSFYDIAGNKRNIFYMGEDIIVRYKYRVNKKVEKPVFGMSIHTEDKMLIFGTNTKSANIVKDYLDSDGEIELRIPANSLNEGTYLFSADVYNYELTFPYDKHNRMYRIKILKNKDIPSYSYVGPVIIPCKWRYL
jgi:ABC-type polysaccharide/polyol phosphate transport system ATPase subunit